MRRDEVEKHG
jgi:hypothetical protein